MPDLMADGGIFLILFFWSYLRSYFYSNPDNKVYFRHLSVTQRSCVQKWELPDRSWFYYWT